MSAHVLRWLAPQPLWQGWADARVPDQARPAILRFADDDFMERLIALLERDPAQLGALLARPENWRTPPGEVPSLLTQTPLPSVVQAAARATAARQPKPPLAPAAPPDDDKPLKLYQPAHQRHYLVSASLVCATPGLPDRAVNPGGAEPTHFVLRRLMGDDSRPGQLAEHAYLADGAGKRWQRVGTGAEAQRAVAGEEPLPLFALAYRDDAAHGRRLWTGSVPVGRREEYLGAEVVRTTAPLLAQGQAAALAPAAAVEAVPASYKLARVAQFQMEVAEPWKTMVRAAVQTAAGLNEVAQASGGPESAEAKARRAQDFNLQQQNISWLVLLDLADYLAAHFDALWTVIDRGGAGVDGLPERQRELYSALAGARVTDELAAALQPVSTATSARAMAASLAAALKAVRSTALRTALEAQPLNYDRRSVDASGWPAFHFLLAGIDTALAASGPYSSFGSLSTTPIPEAPAEAMPAQPQTLSPGERVIADANAAAALMDRLTALVGRALPDGGDSKAPPLPYALKLKNALFATTGDPGWFVVRFVHQRVDCGPLHPPVVSAPSERFQLASFFDSDAPARAIRITLPVDTSPAGLRKFNKNTAFVLSDMLCGQVQRAKGLGLVDLVRAVLPWPLHKDLDVGSGSCRRGNLDIGMICSLSIPIITICALILLIIIVTLLDTIFRWLPFFVMCFPVPGLKGKK